MNLWHGRKDRQCAYWVCPGSRAAIFAVHGGPGSRYPHAVRSANRWRHSALALALVVGCRPEPPAPPPAVAAAPEPAPAPEPELRVRHDAAPAFRDPQRREKLAASFPELRRRVEAFAATEELPGLAVGVVVDDALALFVGVGATAPDGGAPIGEHTVFRIGSLTKLFTATVLLGLRDGGALTLDDPARRFAPELDHVVYPTGDARRITIRDLLLHASGLPRLGSFDYTDPVDAPTRAEIVGSLDRFALRRDPGANYEYSNLGYMLLGLVVEGAAGEGYAKVVERMLFAPLAIDHAAWSPQQAGERLAHGHKRQRGGFVRQDHWNLGAGAAAGGLYLDTADLARFAALHLSAWPPRDAADDGPVRRASLREMARLAHYQGMSVDPSAPELEVRVSGRGLGWGVTQDCRFEQILSHHGGTEGYTSAIYLLPQRGVGVVLLANVAGAPLGRLATELLEGLDDTGALATRRAAPLPALTTTVDALARLLQTWDGARAAELFSSQFYTPAELAGVERTFAWARAQLGACTDWRASSVGEPDSGGFTATCERGSPTLQVALTSTDPPQIATLDLVARQLEADPAIVAAATRAVQMLSAWDDDAFPAVFAANFARAGMRRFLAATNPDGATCTLGQVELVGGEGASFRVHCGARELRLSLGNVDAAGRIGRITAEPAPRDRCGRARAAPT